MHRFILKTISYLHIGVRLNITKVSIILFLLCLWEQGAPGNFQYKSVNSSFNWVSRYIPFLPKLKGKERSFLEGWIMKRRGTTLQNYNLVDIRHEKVSPFVKFETILPLLCFLLDHLKRKYCRTWSSMINLWIDSRTCQK